MGNPLSEAITVTVQRRSVCIRVLIEGVKLNTGRNSMEEKFEEKGKEGGQIPIHLA